MSGLGPLHFTGKVDRQEEMLVMNAQKEQAVLKTLLKNRDPATIRCTGTDACETSTIRQPAARQVKTSCYHFTTVKM